MKERKLKQGGDTGSTLSIDIADFDFESKKKTEKEAKGKPNTYIFQYCSSNRVLLSSQSLVLLLYSCYVSSIVDATPSLQETLADQVAKARERAEEDERAKHVRPWDKGKGEFI